MVRDVFSLHTQEEQPRKKTSLSLSLMPFLVISRRHSHIQIRYHKSMTRMSCSPTTITTTTTLGPLPSKYNLTFKKSRKGNIKYTIRINFTQWKNKIDKLILIKFTKENKKNFAELNSVLFGLYFY